MATAMPTFFFRATDGRVAIWQTNGTSVTSSAVVADPGPNWRAIGTGDFNGDGRSDILLQSTNGSVAIWQMSGTSLTSGAVVADPGPNWRAIGTGDFDGDGHADILLQNKDGRVAIWRMSGTSLTSGAVVADPGPSMDRPWNRRFQWRRPCRHPFSECRWRHRDLGNERDQRDRQRRLANPGPSWTAVGTGDFSGDGHSDILFQNANGQAAIWEMNGTNLTGSGVIASNPGPSWKAI